MSALQPFNPVYGNTKALVGAAGEVVQAYTGSTNPPQLLLSNVGTVTCFVRVSDSTDATAASANDLPVLASTQVVVTANRFSAFNVRLAAGATGSTLYVTQGSGF